MINDAKFFIDRNDIKTNIFHPVYTKNVIFSGPDYQVLLLSQNESFRISVACIFSQFDLYKDEDGILPQGDNIDLTFAMSIVSLDDLIAFFFEVFKRHFLA